MILCSACSFYFIAYAHYLMRVWLVSCCYKVGLGCTWPLLLCLLQVFFFFFLASFNEGLKNSQQPERWKKSISFGYDIYHDQIRIGLNIPGQVQPLGYIPNPFLTFILRQVLSWACWPWTWQSSCLSLKNKWDERPMSSGMAYFLHFTVKASWVQKVTKTTRLLDLQGT